MTNLQEGAKPLRGWAQPAHALGLPISAGLTALPPCGVSCGGSPGSRPPRGPKPGSMRLRAWSSALPLLREQRCVKLRRQRRQGPAGRSAAADCRQRELSTFPRPAQSRGRRAGVETRPVRTHPRIRGQGPGPETAAAHRPPRGKRPRPARDPWKARASARSSTLLKCAGRFPNLLGLCAGWSAWMLVVQGGAISTSKRARP